MVAAGAISACADSGANERASGSGSVRIADVGGRASIGNGDFPVGSTEAQRVMASLALTSSGAVYKAVRDTSSLNGGTIVGRVEAADAVGGDTAVTPTLDTDVCRAFTETIIPAVNSGVGNAVVWLTGVTTGPPQDAPQRVALTMDRCRLEPRVQRMAVGSSVLVKSRDAMTSTLRFVDIGTSGEPRARVDFTDAGQVVPTGAVALTPGVVEIRDERHPWVRAYMAVAPHPFVAVTGADGHFRFDAVPPGRYMLVVWQEALGVRTRALRITTGVETRLVVGY